MPVELFLTDTCTPASELGLE